MALMNKKKGVACALIIVYLLLLVNLSIIYFGGIPGFLYKADPRGLDIFQEEIIYKFQKLERPTTDIETINKSAVIEYDYILTRLEGSSMQPAIMEGDIVLMDRIEDYRDIEEGWIVQCKFYNGVNESSNTLHRVIGIYQSSGYVILQGDHNLYPDGSRCYFENIKGYVTTIIYGGNIINK